MNRPYIPQRVVEGTCALDGPKFTRKICRRCGYRRNAAKEMPRYAMCGDPPVNSQGEENPYAMGTKRVFHMVNEQGTE